MVNSYNTHFEYLLVFWYIYTQITQIYVLYKLTMKTSFINWLIIDTRSHLSLVHGGVNGIDFDNKLNLLATANQNSVVNLFNPYINEPNGVLSGHSREVLIVKFMSSRSQMISVCADKIFRVWNVPLQVCIQRIGNVFSKGPDGCFLYLPIFEIFERLKFLITRLNNEI